MRRGVRACQVLLLNVVVVALAGAALNDQYLFYSSWGDLFGSRSSSVQTHQGGTVPEVVAAPVHGPGLGGAVTPGVLPGLPQPSSRLQTYTVVAARSNAKAQVYVYLRPATTRARRGPTRSSSACTASPRSRRASSGSTSSAPIDLLTAAAPHGALDRRRPAHRHPGEPRHRVRQRRCPGSRRPTRGSRTTSPRGPCSHFRVERKRTSWATLGYSYGAWCAASLTMRHPDVFGAAVVLLGYFRPDFSAAYDPLTTRDGLRDYDLVALARNAPPPVAMWVLTSREDPLSYPTTSKFLSVARPPARRHRHRPRARRPPRLDVFTPYVPNALTWLAQTLPGFRA